MYNIILPDRDVGGAVTRNNLLFLHYFLQCIHNSTLLFLCVGNKTYTMTLLFLFRFSEFVLQNYECVDTAKIFLFELNFFSNENE